MRGALAVVDAARSRTIVVIGDLIVDEYLFGKPARISREAPVLILRFTEREVLLGGAANAAHNVHALGARVVPVGVVGRDAAGDELLSLFHAAGIATDGIVTENGRTTPMKTRIMAGGYQATRQQVVRLDREPSGELQTITGGARVTRARGRGRPLGPRRARWPPPPPPAPPPPPPPPLLPPPPPPPPRRTG